MQIIVTVRVEDDLVEWLDAVSEADGQCSRSSVIRRLLAKARAEETAAQPPNHRQSADASA
jgi:metal-responsive CopG/Arc/MetJ family transcriptional regulator